MVAVRIPRTPTEIERRRFRLRLLAAAGLVVFLTAVCLFWRIVPEVPERFETITEHFKYGSIGADNEDRGVPYWLWKVLPEVFPEHLPAGGTSGYAALGFIHEPGADRPIGLSKRRVQGLDLVGLNCAACHTGRYRKGDDSEPQVVLGMPANTLDLQAYFEFLFNCAADPRFDVATIMDRIRAETTLDVYENFAYPQAIQAFQEKALAQHGRLDYWNDIPKFGPGRVDTFTPYKRLFFTELPVGAAVGTADFPSLWNQRVRQGMYLHWDGNNPSVEERNISAALGAGVRPHPSTLDESSMARLRDWIMDFRPPSFPKPLQHFNVRRGAILYAQHCADCHAVDGSRVGQVEPIEKIKTDRHRLDSFTDELARKMNTLGEGYPWRFEHFRKTYGYANMPLDGIWLRGPYLHNGSVPTLRHLLLPPDQRPKKFWRGDDRYLWDDVGFAWQDAKTADRPLFEFDTSAPGNGNGGHEYGTALSPDEREALLEFLKTL